MWYLAFWLIVPLHFFLACYSKQMKILANVGQKGKFHCETFLAHQIFFFSYEYTEFSFHNASLISVYRVLSAKEVNKWFLLISWVTSMLSSSIALCILCLSKCAGLEGSLLLLWVFYLLRHISLPYVGRCPLKAH